MKQQEGLRFDALSRQVIGCAIEVHRELGPGLLESTYQRCLSRELEIEGIVHVCEASLPVEYKGLKLECGYRIDVLVDNQLILELKCVKTVEPIHEAQILTYMKLSGVKTGILLNFNTIRLKEGIKRYVL